MSARLLKPLFAVLLAGALGACTLMSKNPAGTEEAAVAEPGLMGHWMNTGENGEVTFLHILPRAESEGKLLQILFTGGDDKDGGWYALDGHATALPDGQRYLNLKLYASTPDAIAELDSTYADRADYPYSFMPYKVIDADTMQLGAPPMEEALAAVKDGKLAGTVADPGGSFPIAKVSDTPQNIAAFLAGVDQAKAFAEPLEFKRIKNAAP